MRRASSIFPRSSRLRKMLRAGGHVPVHTVAPASASALAIAKPYPPSSDRKSTRLNSSHSQISYAVFCLKKKNTEKQTPRDPRHLRFLQRLTRARSLDIHVT